MRRLGLFAFLTAVAFTGCSQSTNEQLAATLAPYAVSFASAAFLWLAAWGARWMAAHTKNANIRTGIERLNDAVNVTVRAVEQTMVTSLKARTSGGRLSSADARATLEAAINSVKDHFGPKDLVKLAKDLGVDDLTDLVRVRIEAAVQNMRAPDASPGPVAGVAAPAPAPAPAIVVTPATIVEPGSKPSGLDAIAALHRAAGRG